MNNIDASVDWFKLLDIYACIPPKRYKQLYRILSTPAFHSEIVQLRSCSEDWGFWAHIEQLFLPRYGLDKEWYVPIMNVIRNREFKGLTADCVSQKIAVHGSEITWDVQKGSLTISPGCGAWEEAADCIEAFSRIKSTMPRLGKTNRRSKEDFMANVLIAYALASGLTKAGHIRKFVDDQYRKYCEANIGNPPAVNLPVFEQQALNARIRRFNKNFPTINNDNSLTYFVSCFT